MDPTNKTYSVRALLTAPQKLAVRSIVQALGRKQRRCAGQPTEQDAILAGLAAMCRRFRVAWPSSARKSKRIPRQSYQPDPGRSHTIRAVLTREQKEALGALRQAVHARDDRAEGHASVPTEIEVVVDALADLARAHGIPWPCQKSCAVPAAREPVPVRLSPGDLRDLALLAGLEPDRSVPDLLRDLARRYLGEQKQVLAALRRLHSRWS